MMKKWEIVEGEANEDKKDRDPLALKWKNDLPSVKTPNRNHGDDKKIRSSVQQSVS